MREWIRLCENYTVHPFEEFYHGSQRPLPIGTVLKYHGTSGIDVEVEEILERFRPANCRTRKCVFVTDSIRSLETLTAHYDHLYVVQPQGNIQRYDGVWLNFIWRGLAMQDNGTEFTDDQQRGYALGYWSGEAAPRHHGEETAWEFLCDSAVVEEEIDP